jgi:hypothetical protein
VDFLKCACDECGIDEMYPPNPNPPKTGNLIRLPLGIHRRRLQEGKANAVSHLCKIENGIIEKVTKIEDVIHLLENWKAVSNEQVLNVTEKRDKNIFVNDVVVPVTGILETIRMNECRACIKYILSHATKQGYRNKTAFNLSLYLSNILLLEKDEVRRLVTEWNNTLTSPRQDTNELNKAIEGAFNFDRWIRCKKNKCLDSICMNNNLEIGCAYLQNMGPLPVNNRRLYATLMKGNVAENKIELALRTIFHSKSTNPLRGDRWFRTNKHEILEASGIAESTLLNPISAGENAGKTRFQVLKDNGRIDYEIHAGSGFYWVRVCPE